MRGKGVIAACVGLALLTAGCSRDSIYLREGVGTEVSYAGVAAVTNLQEIYFGEICRQAGLPVRQTPDGALFCDEASTVPGAWTIFVQAGMNDIDRRCDAYLAWLDNRRRWNEPILKQLHSTAAVTAAVMGLSGVGATSIAIAGAAFGFAQETFVNLSGRLITEINQSTVQSLVLTRQNEYREGLRGKAIPNKPAALYALRSYLRVCMPMTIETEINTTIVSVERNNAQPGRMITPATISGSIITDATAPVQRQERQRIVSVNRHGAVEQSLSGRLIGAYQAALCVPQDGDLGPASSVTRMAIRDYLTARTGRPGGEDPLTVSARNLLNDAVDRVGNCATQNYQNAYEVGAFGAPRGDPQARIRAFQDDLRTALADQKSPLAASVPDSGVLDSKTRDAIAEFRRVTNSVLPGANNPRNRQVDSKLKRSVTP